MVFWVLNKHWIQSMIQEFEVYLSLNPPSEHVFPVHPDSQEHWKSSSTLEQDPPFLHGLGSQRSTTTAKNKKKLYIPHCIKVIFIFISDQNIYRSSDNTIIKLLPSEHVFPVHCEVQAHSKSFSMLEQDPPFSQGFGSQRSTTTATEIIEV